MILSRCPPFMGGLCLGGYCPRLTAPVLLTARLCVRLSLSLVLLYVTPLYNATIESHPTVLCESVLLPLYRRLRTLGRSPARDRFCTQSKCPEHARFRPLNLGCHFCYVARTGVEKLPGNSVRLMVCTRSRVGLHLRMCSAMAVFLS